MFANNADLNNRDLRTTTVLFTRNKADLILIDRCLLCVAFLYAHVNSLTNVRSFVLSIIPSRFHSCLCTLFTLFVALFLTCLSPFLFAAFSYRFNHLPFPFRNNVYTAQIILKTNTKKGIYFRRQLTQRMLILSWCFCYWKFCVFYLIRLNLYNF